jgi:CRP-like cAMP-binding protein
MSVQSGLSTEKLPNAILSALPADVLARLNVESREREPGTVLFRPQQPPDFSYFPAEGAVISIVRVLSNGGMVEVGIIGFDGFAAVQGYLADTNHMDEGVVQNRGMVNIVRTAVLRSEAERSPQLRALLLRYTSSFLQQVSQNAACNRLHTIEQRLAKWLLIVRERTTSDEMNLTHEFLAQMLGIQRAGVTIAIGVLTHDGLIEHSRKSITIIDREGLMVRACECFAAVHEALQLSLRSV